MLILDEFSHMLKERDADRTLLYCHASADEEAAADARRHGRNQWLLVTSKSDVPSVLACNTFKLTPRPSGHKESEVIDVAFPPGAAAAPPPKKPKKGAEPPPPKNGGARSGRRKGKDAQAECERLFRGRDDATDITDATSAADDYPGARANGRGPPPSLAPSAGPPKLRMDDERRGGAADDASRARRQLLD